MGKPKLRADLTALLSPPTELLMAERLFPDDTWVIILSIIEVIPERRNYVHLKVALHIGQQPHGKNSISFIQVLEESGDRAE